jgi:pimeloyl-ACP methyl ester carboxylesterase
MCPQITQIDADQRTGGFDSGSRERDHTRSRPAPTLDRLTGGLAFSISIYLRHLRDLRAVIFQLCLLLIFGSITEAAVDSPETRDIAFKAACDGSEQKYVIVFPSGFDKNKAHDVLIALHGHGSDRWQFVKDARDECRSARGVAAERGMIFVSPDYRAKTSWMGPKAEADLVQIINDLRHEYRVGRVFVCGGSMGASSALTFAALHPDLVAGVAAMNGTANHLEYENFQEAIRDSFGGTKAQIPAEYKARSAEYWPERFTMPVGLSAGGKDKSVPPDSVVRLAKVLQNMGRPVLLVYRENGGHSTNYEDGRRIIEFAIDSAPPAGPATAPASRPASSGAAVTLPQPLDEAVTWLHVKSLEMIRNSRRRMIDGTVAFSPQVGAGYEAFWLRDYACIIRADVNECVNDGYHNASKYVASAALPLEGIRAMQARRAKSR